MEWNGRTEGPTTCSPNEKNEKRQPWSSVCGNVLCTPQHGYTYRHSHIDTRTNTARLTTFSIMINSIIINRNLLIRPTVNWNFGYATNYDALSIKQCTYREGQKSQSRKGENCLSLYKRQFHVLKRAKREGNISQTNGGVHDMIQ